MIITLSIILIVMLAGSLGALFAFSWAATHQQFENLREGAESIFDADEPIGTPTDPNLTDQHDS